MCIVLIFKNRNKCLLPTFITLTGKLVLLLVQYTYTKCYAYLRELLSRLLQSLGVFWTPTSNTLRRI